MFPDANCRLAVRALIQELAHSFSGSRVVMATLCGLLLTACGDSSDGSVAESPTSNEVRVELESRYKQVGTALFEPSEHGTRVTLSLRKPLTNAWAAMYAGSCFERGSGIMDLTSVVDGRSRTELALSIDDVTSKDFAVVVSADSGMAKACGRFVASGPREPAPRRAAAIVACHPPHPGYGFEEGLCATVQKLERMRAGVWRVQLRLPPVYCVAIHLDRYSGDPNLDVESVGKLEEVRCPPAAYSGKRQVDVRADLRTHAGKQYGTVSLTALGPNRTRVVVETDADWAWISRGSCPSPDGRHEFDLTDFYSFRSETTLPVPLQSLTATPHSLLVDGGGAHGGDPYACADLSSTR